MDGMVSLTKQTILHSGIAMYFKADGLNWHHYHYQGPHRPSEI